MQAWGYAWSSGWVVKRFDAFTYHACIGYAYDFAFVTNREDSCM